MLRGCCVPTPTQRAIPSGSVNEYQRKLGSKTGIPRDALAPYQWSCGFGWCPGWGLQETEISAALEARGKGLYYCYVQRGTAMASRLNCPTNVEVSSSHKLEFYTNTFTVSLRVRSPYTLLQRKHTNILAGKRLRYMRLIHSFTFTSAFMQWMTTPDVQLQPHVTWQQALGSGGYRKAHLNLEQITIRVIGWRKNTLHRAVSLRHTAVVILYSFSFFATRG